MFEDNFFDMAPGEKRTLAIIDAAGGKQISIKALNADAVHVAFE